MNAEIMGALDQLEKEKGIPKDYMLEKITQALLSAIPMPDPEMAKNQKLLVYDPELQDYTRDAPEWTEIEPGHFVMANKQELEEYRKEIAEA